jgi:hypothetical protein
MDDKVFNRFVELVAAACESKSSSRNPQYNWDGIAMMLNPLLEESRRTTAKTSSSPAAATVGWKEAGLHLVLDGDALRNIYIAALKWLRGIKFYFYMEKLFLDRKIIPT